MTREAVDAFQEKIKSDTGLSRKLLQTNPADRAALVAVVSAAGFLVDDRDADAILAIRSAMDGELSETEMDDISGGDGEGGEGAYGGEGAPGAGGF